MNDLGEFDSEDVVPRTEGEQDDGALPAIEAEPDLRAGAMPSTADENGSAALAAEEELDGEDGEMPFTADGWEVVDSATLAAEAAWERAQAEEVFAAEVQAGVHGKPSVGWIELTDITSLSEFDLVDFQLAVERYARYPAG